MYDKIVARRVLNPTSSINANTPATQKIKV